MASPLTVWSSTADGLCSSYNTDYAVARATVNASNNNQYTLDVGQQYTSSYYYCFESFVGFDTSSIGADATVTLATLSLYGKEDTSLTDFTLEARIRDWGGTLTTADWVSGTPADTPSLDELTLVASRSTAPSWPTSAYNALTSEAAFATNIAKTGTTYLILDSSRHVAGNQPSGYEIIGSWSAEDNTGGGGTDRDPKLYVEWTTGGTADRTCLIQFGVC